MKIAWGAEVSFRVRLGITEEVPEIDKIGIQPPVRVFRDECFAVIDVFSTDINGPRQPED
jgi:hypothetical protein